MGKGSYGALSASANSWPGGQPDDARERELLLGEVIGGGDQLLLARLIFDLRAQRVDRGRDSGLLLRDRFVVERLGGVDLRLRGFDPRSAGNRLQVGVAGGEHDQIARASFRLKRATLSPITEERYF